VVTHSWTLKYKSLNACIPIAEMGGCHCYQLADEPDQHCPAHSIPEHKCYYCNRYMPWDHTAVRHCTSKAPR